MFKKICSVILIIIFCLGLSQVTWGDTIDRRDYAFGWQYSKSASGLTLKIPVSDSYYLQPTFSFSQLNNEQQTQSGIAIGMRALQELPFRFDYQPYFGIGAGYSRNDPAVGVDTYKAGCEVFFGVEYRKYLLRPAMEVCMGNYRQSNGDSYTGLSVNFSLQYSF